MKNLYESILSSVRAGRAAFPNGAYNVDDILYTVFVYSSVIPQFYQVIGHKGKSSIIVKELAKINGYNGTTRPEKDVFARSAREMVVRISNGTVKIDGLVAKKWDGEPVEYEYAD